MTNETPTNLAVVDCCATCLWFRGCLDNAWCKRYQLRILPQTKCDTFERRPDLPIWIVAEPIVRER